MIVRLLLVMALLFAGLSANVSATTATASITCAGNIDAAIDSALDLVYTGGADTLIITLTAGTNICKIAEAHPITGAITVSFVGPGTDTSIFMGGTPTVPRFQVSAGAHFSISNVTAESSVRGVISVSDAMLLADSMAFLNNTSDMSGGAITATGSTVTITRSTFDMNAAQLNGGAIDIEGSGSLSVTDSTFSNNQFYPSSIGEGGAIFSSGAAVTLNRVLFTSNKSTNAYGGAVAIDSADLIARNVTFATDQAQFGGAIAIIGSGVHSVSLNNVTMRSGTASMAGAELFVALSASASTISIDNSVISASGACAGFSSAPAAHNSVESPGNTCELPTATNRVSVVDANLHLGDLADNGGYTSTIAPQSSSVLIDTGGIDCEPVDQRDYTRNVNACDVGAVEAGATDRIFLGRFE